MRCEICGHPNGDTGLHHCNPRRLAQIEARYRREEEAEVEEEEPSFEERLETGFAMLAGMNQS